MKYAPLAPNYLFPDWGAGVGHVCFWHLATDRRPPITSELSRRGGRLDIAVDRLRIAGHASADSSLLLRAGAVPKNIRDGQSDSNLP